MEDKQVAKNAYMQSGDVVMLGFIQQLQERFKRGEWREKDTTSNSSTLLALGDVSAYLGNFAEASSYYGRAGSELGGTKRIVEMYTDLRRFEEAREAMAAIGDKDGRRQLLTKHADWARSTNEHRTAAKMYIDAGEYLKAIELSNEHGWTDVLLDISRRLDKGEQECLELCAKYLARLGEYAFAADCYAKYGDIENQLALHVQAHNWEEAFYLSEQNPGHTEDVYVPYAQWLAENDRFEEAQAAFIKAGLQNEAIRVLEQLATCAAKESRFDDAGFYHWKLSMQCLEMIKEEKTLDDRRQLLVKFQEFHRKADIYYVYHNIHRYLHEPFASHMPETYFNMARYLTHMIQTEEIPFVSKASILFTLAKHGQSLGAYKLTHQVFDRLRNLHMPHEMREAMELASIAIRSCPFQDSEDITVICYRCSTTNPLLSSAGNRCINCKEPFMYSFITLEQLPLVEFVPEDGLSHDEVMEYLRKEPIPKTSKAESDDGDKYIPSGGSQTLKINPNSNEKSLDKDAFTIKLMNSDLVSDTYSPIQLDATTLRAIPISEVIVINQPPLRPRYYKSVLPEVSITQCLSCHKLFNTDDYELVALQKGHCPYCRLPKE